MATKPHDSLQWYRTERTPLLTGSAAVFPWCPKMAKRYRFMSAFEEVPIPLHRKAKYRQKDGTLSDVILIPRGFAPTGNLDRRTEGFEVDFTSKFIPRDKEQIRLVTEASMLLCKGCSFILEAPTGVGKTWMAMELIARIRRRTLVVVHKEDVKAQWVQAAKTLLDLKPEDIGFIQGDQCDVEGKKLVIGMIQSLSKPGRYPLEKFKGFGFIIVDEVHRMGADKFSQMIWYQPAMLRMGMSATPYRRDGKDVVFQAHIGPVAVRSEVAPLTPLVLMFFSDWQLPWVNWGGKHQPLPHDPGKLGKVNNLIAGDQVRNKQIAFLVVQAYKKERTTIVFSHLREKHLSRLEDAIIQAGVPLKDIGWYVGGLNEEQRYWAGRKRVVLATYSMASEATDLPWLDTCILTTPRADVKQIVGRILRQYEDKKSPVVVDIVDADSNILLKFSVKRRKWYESIGATVKRGRLSALQVV